MPRGKGTTQAPGKTTCNRRGQDDSSKLKKSADANSKKLNKRKLVTEDQGDSGLTKKKKLDRSVPKAKTKNSTRKRTAEEPKSCTSTATRFREDDNFIEFEVTGDNDAFPSNDEEAGLTDKSSQCEEDSETKDGEIELSQNNNATREGKDCEESDLLQSEISSKGEVDQNVSLKESFSIMQDFLLHKGVLSESLGQDDLEEFLEGVKLGKEKGGIPKGSRMQEKVATQMQTMKVKNRTCKTVSHKWQPDTSSSVTTIYKNTVPQAPSPVNTISTG